MNSCRFACVVSAFGLFAAAAAGQTQPATPTTPAPQSQEAKPAPKVYDEAADAKKQIAAALRKAKKENRRVLIQWGGNWCPWCIRMHELYKSDAEIRKTLMYEYDVVFVDAGKPKGKNIDLAKSFGAELEGKNGGYPYLTILDADGKPIANQETGSLEVKGADGESVGVQAGQDPKAVLKFLKDHAAAPRSADETLAAGLSAAKSSGKSVFLHFGAPWCGWCHRLEDWMAKPEIAAILAKDFIDVKIDVDRMTGGKDLKDKYTGGKEGGIPWFVFLSADGKAKITSDGPKGNTGYPAASEEIEHFGKMLRAVNKNMSEGDVRTLIQSLKESAPKQGS